MRGVPPGGVMMVKAKAPRFARQALTGLALATVVATTTTTAIGAAPAAAATRPGTPKITSAVAIEQGVTLTFTKPSDGGTRITSYVVRCTSTDGGLAVKAFPLASPATITGMAAKKHYTCVVSAFNSVGAGPASKPSATFVPKVQDSKRLPVAPTVLGVKAEVETIFVTYSKPPYDPHLGRLFVNRYRAKCSSPNGGVTRREERSWTIPGIEVQHLTAGKTYRCIVSARNSNGWGAYSKPSDPVVPLFPAGPPSAPKITAATAIVRGIRIAFTPPASDGGSPIIDYRAKCTSTNGGTAADHSVPRHSPYDFVGLSVGKKYTCTLAAHNKSGVGAFSAPSATVVPLSA